MEEHTIITPGEVYTFKVPPENKGARLDAFLVEQFPSYSRSLFKKLIEQGAATLNQKVVTKAGTLIKDQDTIVLTVPVPEKRKPLDSKEADKLGVTLIHQEKDFAIVNKPAGLMTHAPHSESTETSLVDWLLTQFKDIKNVGYEDRPGIVHRLDKDTSGLLIVPLIKQSHAAFSDMFKDRTINKTYYAVVTGHPEKEGIIDFPIGRHQTIRNKMTHRIDGRASVTRFKVKEYFDEYTLVEVFPETGRTHQIRVHFAALGHPLVGDKMYGKASHMINRHALHAAQIRFNYKNKTHTFSANQPEDFSELVSTLKKKMKKN